MPKGAGAEGHKRELGLMVQGPWKCPGRIVEQEVGCTEMKLEGEVWEDGD